LVRSAHGFVLEERSHPIIHYTKGGYRSLIFRRLINVTMQWCH